MNLSEIRRAGEIKELKEQIHYRIHELGYRNFEGYMSGKHFTSLTEKIQNADKIINEIKILFEELKSLESENK